MTGVFGQAPAAMIDTLSPSPTNTQVTVTVGLRHTF
jgi:hypothetical protein